MLGFPMCAANATTCGMAVLPPGPKGGWQCVVQPVPAASRHVLNYGYGRVFLGIVQAGPGSAGDAEFVTATQSGALGVCIPPNRDGMRHTPTYVLSRLNTDHTTRKRPIPPFAGRIWTIRGCLRGQIPPVSGWIWMLVSLPTYQFLQ